MDLFTSVFIPSPFGFILLSLWHSFFVVIIFICSPLSTGFIETVLRPADVFATKPMAHHGMIRGFFTFVDIGGYRKWAQKSRVAEIS
ncbi:MAG: hypothetical protein WCD00_05605 [Desulfuromonadaceae bacterium]